MLLGRFITTEFQGAGSRKMWVTQVYSPCDPSGEDAEGYWNLILQQIRELKEGGEEMQEDEKGKLSPTKQMIKDLTTLRDLRTTRTQRSLSLEILMRAGEKEGCFRNGSRKTAG